MCFDNTVSIIIMNVFVNRWAESLSPNTPLRTRLRLYVLNASGGCLIHSPIFPWRLMIRDTALIGKSGRKGFLCSEWAGMRLNCREWVGRPDRVNHLREPSSVKYTPSLHNYQGMPSAYKRRFYHREFRGHREAFAEDIILLFSVNSVLSVVHHIPHRR